MGHWVWCLTLPTVLTSAQPAPEAGGKKGSIHTPTVIIWFFGQYLSFGQVGPSPCKVHLVPGKHHSSDRDCTVSIHHQPHHGEAQALSWGQNMPWGNQPSATKPKAQGSENLLRSYPKGKALGAVTKLHYTEN